MESAYAPDVETLEFPDYLDLVQAAAALGIHPQSVRRLIKRGDLPAVLWQSKYLIDRYTLLQFKSSYVPQPGRGNKRVRRLL